MFASKAKRFAFLYLLLLHDFSGISGNTKRKKHVTEYQTANTVQLFVAIKGKLSGLLFF